MENTNNASVYLVCLDNMVTNDKSKAKIEDAHNTKIKIITQSQACDNIIDNIQDNDRIMISSHGLTDKTVETYEPFLCKFSEKKNVLKEISKGKACNFELFTCHSGGAIYYTDLPEFSTLITLTEHDLLSMTSLDDELIIKSASFVPYNNPFIRYPSYIFVNPGQVQFAINIGNNIKKNFTSTPLTIELAKNITLYEVWHNQTLQSFLNFTAKLHSTLFTLLDLNLTNKEVIELRYNQIQELHAMDLMQNHTWFSQFDTNRSRELSFLNAIHAADVNITKAFLDSEVNINAKLESEGNALHVAVLALEMRNTNFTGKNATALRIAYSNIARMLVNKTGIALDEKEQGCGTALHCAVGGPTTHFTEVALILIEAGASLTIENKQGAAPIHIAANEDYADIVEAMLKKAKEDNIPLVNIQISETGNNKDSVGKLPIHMSAKNGDLNITKILLQYGADIDLVDKSYRTALCYAVYSKHVNITKLFIQQGANINFKCQESLSPLSAATNNNHLEMVQLLLASGANSVIMRIKS